MTQARAATDGQLLTIADYEEHARQLTAPALFEMMYGSHGDPNWSTYTSNRAGFHALKLRARVLVDTSRRSLATTLLGIDLAFPVIVGPTGGLDAHDPGGEIPTLEAAGAMGTVMVVTGVSTRPIDEIAAAAEGPWFQQVWMLEDRRIVEWQVRRAEALGAAAIVLTVSNAGDTLHTIPLRWPSRSAEDDVPEPLSHLRDYADGPVPSTANFAGLISQSVTWADLEWLRSLTSLPLVVKGIQTGEDAELCVQHGVDAIVVSNHGGRFLQGSRGTVEALPEVVAAAGDHLEVCIDGGIRQGQDILKALALGARAVWIGRAARWGAAVGGKEGVVGVLEILRRELEGTMGLCGVTDVTQVPADTVVRGDFPSREG
ncbi:MAG TPA: alpha-hydroxy acid oxidase [Gaiellaceae bacterium]|jgi:isopentenyl diphosphate isomerase/L-lactate dehydrogenase-like FMN-dependent dehydrogenase|nr:alpha-hydroxy acid oxidase [Gaiellaceae bacterium]